MDKHVRWQNICEKYKRKEKHPLDCCCLLDMEKEECVPTDISEVLVITSSKLLRRKSECHISPSNKDWESRTLCSNCMKNAWGEHFMAVCTTCIR